MTNTNSAIALIVIAAIAVVAVFLVVAILWCVGAFSSVSLENDTLDAKTFVYRTRRGAYSGIGALAFTVQSFVDQHGLRAQTTLAAVYYDDPAQFCCCDEPRYAVGFLLDDDAAIARWESLRNTARGKKYSVLEIPENTATLASRFRGSRFFAASKSFRALAHEGHDFRTGCLQIYNRGTIETHFPRDHLQTFKPRPSDPFPKAAVT